ncbi:MAG: DUF805 domain-containing protein [Bacteroidota bacterium]
MSEMKFWYREVLSKYADFTGRARRSEYWYFTLFNLLVVIAAIAIGGGTVGFYGDGIGMPIFWAIYGFVILYSLAMLIPSLAVTVRRLHDTGRSGWWYLLSFVPFGTLLLLYFFVVEGDYGPNAYGPDPKDLDDLDNRIDELYEDGGAY